MADVTGGRVSYSRTVQPAKYESVRAEAELSFVLVPAEDPSEVLAEVGEIVRASALELVGMRRDEDEEEEDGEDEPLRRSRRRSRD